MIIRSRELFLVGYRMLGILKLLKMQKDIIHSLGNLKRENKAKDEMSIFDIQLQDCKLPGGWQQTLL